MNRNLTLLSIIAGMLLLATNSYAMHFSLKLGDDITANKDTISFASDVYYKNGGFDVEERQIKYTVEGIYLDKTQDFINSVSSMLAPITPIDSLTGKHSILSFGYIKADGTKVWPASCQNLQATMEMNVVLTEAGCVVS